jgi:uncharacterized protein YjbI with pentapeptide repeats
MRPKLGGADLWRANLSKADLLSADLTGANLRGVDLTSAAHVSQEQINLAYGDMDTTLPPNLKRPSSWAK